jgi:hypothetical protein
MSALQFYACEGFRASPLPSFPPHVGCTSDLPRFGCALLQREDRTVARRLAGESRRGTGRPRRAPIKSDASREDTRTHQVRTTPMTPDAQKQRRAKQSTEDELIEAQSSARALDRIESSAHSSARVCAVATMLDLRHRSLTSDISMHARIHARCCAARSRCASSLRTAAAALCAWLCSAPFAARSETRTRTHSHSHSPCPHHLRSSRHSSLRPSRVPPRRLSRRR